MFEFNSKSISFSRLLPLFIFTSFLLVGLTGHAQAAGDGPDGTTELDGATAITADVVGGLIESGATGTQTDSINVNGTVDLILGAEGSAGADAITLAGSASALAETINVTDSVGVATPLQLLVI